MNVETQSRMINTGGREMAERTARALIAVAACTLMRKREILILHVEDVVFEGGTCTLPVWQGRCRRDEAARLMLDATATELLVSHMQTLKGKTGLLFPSLPKDLGRFQRFRFEVARRWSETVHAPGSTHRH